MVVGLCRDKNPKHVVLFRSLSLLHSLFVNVVFIHSEENIRIALLTKRSAQMDLRCGKITRSLSFAANKDGHVQHNECERALLSEMSPHGN